jgi:hypothetical protein
VQRVTGLRRLPGLGRVRARDLPANVDALKRHVEAEPPQHHASDQAKEQAHKRDQPAPRQRASSGHAARAGQRRRHPPNRWHAGPATSASACRFACPVRPPPGEPDSDKVPALASTRRSTMAGPSPVPPVWPGANRRNARRCCSALITGPSSATVITAWPLAAVAAMRMLPPGRSASRALAMRLSRACSRCSFPGLRQYWGRGSDRERHVAIISRRTPAAARSRAMSYTRRALGERSRGPPGPRRAGRSRAGPAG